MTKIPAKKMNGFWAGTVLESAAQRERMMGLPSVSVATRLGGAGGETEPQVETLYSAAAAEMTSAASVTDEEQFAGLVERQSRLMFRVAYALLRNAHDAEDAVQETFLKLYRGGAWLRIEDEKAFLARAVWRVALDRLPPKAGTMTDVTEIELEAEGDSPEESAADGQERERLRRLIDALPEELRQVLLLSAIEEMTSREVAAALGIPEGTVRTRLMRAKAELKRRFEAAERVARW